MQGRRWKSSWPISEHRLADAAREKVVEEEMDLREHARRTSGAVVHGYGRLDAELHGSPDPQYPGIDRSGGRAAAAVERLRERKLDDGDHAVERFGEADVLHEGLQVGEAVLQREAEPQHVRVPLRRLDAGLVHSRGARARGHRDPGGPGYRERPQVLHAVGEIAEAFAVENGRRHGVE